MPQGVFQTYPYLFKGGKKNHKREFRFYKKQIEAAEMERAATKYKVKWEKAYP